MDQRSYLATIGAKFGRWVALWLCLFLIPSAIGAPLKIPASVPIKFGAEKSIEFSVAIERNRNYYLNLALVFDDESKRGAARKIVGDASNICHAVNDCGEETDFIVTIRANDAVLLQREKRAYGHYALTSREYWRNILIVPLRPGIYTFKIDVIGSGKDITSEKSEIRLITNPLEQDLVD